MTLAVVGILAAIGIGFLFQYLRDPNGEGHA